MAKLLVYHLEGVRAHCFLGLHAPLIHGRWSHSVTGKGVHELVVVDLPVVVLIALLDEAPHVLSSKRHVPHLKRTADFVLIDSARVVEIHVLEGLANVSEARRNGISRLALQFARL